MLGSRAIPVLSAEWVRGGTCGSHDLRVVPAATSAVAPVAGAGDARDDQPTARHTRSSLTDPGNSARRADGGRDELLLLPLTGLQKGLRHARDCPGFESKWAAEHPAC